VRWASLDEGAGVCVPVETCVNSDACADNTVTGLTACAPSPYEGTDATICQRP
jgi:hypothetical protein